METEIKLLLPEGRRAAVEGHPAMAAAEPTDVHQISTYYDTPDFALRGRGVTLRIRSAGDACVQTVKWRDGTGGFADRGEAEWVVEPGGIDRVCLASDPEASRRVGDDLERLAPVFATDITRTRRSLALADETVVEAAIDEGEARAGERRSAISEVELELKRGPAAPMLALALDMAREAGLHYGPEPKSERGYALLTDAPPPREPSGAPAFAPDVTVGEALAELVAAGCRDFAAELPGAARGDVEGIHRLRAAIRRLRMLLALFAPQLDRGRAAPLDAMLADLGRTLGAGRDWDVFLTETLAEAESDLGRETVAPLRAAASRSDREAHAAVAAAMSGETPTTLLLGLALWAADGTWARDEHVAARPLADSMPDLLDRMERRVMKRGRHLGSRDDIELHALRKSLKKLRYACEDAAPLFEAAVVARYVGNVKKLLQDLGAVNDSAETAQRIADLATPDRQDLAPGAEAVLEWNAKRRKRRLRDLRGRWRKFRRAEPFWA